MSKPTHLFKPTHPSKMMVSAVLAAALAAPLASSGARAEDGKAPVTAADAKPADSEPAGAKEAAPAKDGTVVKKSGAKTLKKAGAMSGAIEK